MKPPADDLENRRPVWNALSDLFLDTELDESDHARMAGILAASPYSIDEIERILFCEVYPVCVLNLLSIAGVWDGFDPDGLEKWILKWDRSAWKRLASFRIGRRLIPDDWRTVKERAEALRAGRNRAEP